jgi:hypothetical protein
VGVNGEAGYDVCCMSTAGHQCDKGWLERRPDHLLDQLRAPVFCKYMGRMSLGAAL